MIFEKTRRLWKEWKTFRSYVPLLRYEDEIERWTEEDSDQLAAFFEGRLGRKLNTRMRLLYHNLLHDQVVKDGNADVAKGYWMAVANLMALSATLPKEHRETEPEGTDRDELWERLRP